MGRPGDYVDGGSVQGKTGNGCPLGLGRLAPDEDFAIVGGGCEDGAVFRVCLIMKRVRMREGFWEVERRTDP